MTEQSRTAEALDYFEQLREASDRLDHAEYSHLHDLISAIAEPAACSCTGHSEDRGGGHFELVIEPEPGCPEHGASIVAPVTADDPCISPIGLDEIEFSRIEYGLALEEPEMSCSHEPVLEISEDIADPEGLQQWLPRGVIVERRVTISKWVRSEHDDHSGDDAL